MTSSAMRHGVPAVAAVLAVLALGACTTPVPTARSAADYRKKAGATADTAKSAVNTALMAIGVDADGGTFARTLDVVLAEAEDDASGAGETFRAIQPRGDAAEADAVRHRLVDLLDDAVDALEASRIAARRRDKAALQAQAPQLRAAADALDAFERSLG
jgi:hypothetical protein